MLQAEIDRVRAALAEAELRATALRDEIASLPAPLDRGGARRAEAEREAAEEAARRAGADAAPLSGRALPAGRLPDAPAVAGRSGRAVRWSTEQRALRAELARETAANPLGNPRVAEIRARLASIDAELRAAAERIAGRPRNGGREGSCPSGRTRGGVLPRLLLRRRRRCRTCRGSSRRLRPTGETARRGATQAGRTKAERGAPGRRPAPLPRDRAGSARLARRAHPDGARLHRGPDPRRGPRRRSRPCQRARAPASAVRAACRPGPAATRRCPFPPGRRRGRAAARWRTNLRSRLPSRRPRWSLGAVADSIAGRRRVVVTLAEESDGDGRPLAAVALARALAGRDRAWCCSTFGTTAPTASRWGRPPTCRALPTSSRARCPSPG